MKGIGEKSKKNLYNYILIIIKNKNHKRLAQCQHSQHKAQTEEVMEPPT